MYDEIDRYKTAINAIRPFEGELLKLKYCLKFEAIGHAATYDFMSSLLYNNMLHKLFYNNIDQ